MNKLLVRRTLLGSDSAEPAPVALSTTPTPLTAAQLHERYLENVSEYVARRVARRSEAEDITAEVFIAAFTNLSRCKSGLPLAWLLGIARRKVAESVRRSARRKETLEAELTASSAAAEVLLAQASLAQLPEQIVQCREARRHIQALVDALPTDQREALLLQYVEDLSATEIGVVMGRSSKAVNSLLQRARANLFKTGRGYFLAEFSPKVERENRSIQA